MGGNSHDVDLICKNPATARAAMIEVKASRYTQFAPGRRGFQFLMFKAGRSQPITEDFVLLACVLGGRDQLTLGGAFGGGADRKRIPPAWFVLPAEKCAGIHKIAIPGNPFDYRGKWAEYFNAWELLDSHMQGGCHGTKIK